MLFVVLTFAGVAPHGGAWIETKAFVLTGDKSKSPLTEGRGLKLCRDGRIAAILASPLTEGRGLKQKTNDQMDLSDARRPSRRGVD